MADPEPAQPEARVPEDPGHKRRIQFAKNADDYLREGILSLVRELGTKILFGEDLYGKEEYLNLRIRHFALSELCRRAGITAEWIGQTPPKGLVVLATKREEASDNKRKVVVESVTPP